MMQQLVPIYITGLLPHLLQDKNYTLGIHISIIFENLLAPLYIDHQKFYNKCQYLVHKYIKNTHQWLRRWLVAQWIKYLNTKRPEFGSPQTT